MAMTSLPESDRTPAAPLARRGIASDVFIACVLIAQIAIPLRYYLRGRGTDERFSWRMFSTQRMERCSVEVEETLESRAGTPRRSLVALDGALHPAWVSLLERGRSSVVEKFLVRLCAKPEVAALRYVRRCEDPSGHAGEVMRVERSCADAKPKVAGSAD